MKVKDIITGDSFFISIFILVFFLFACSPHNKEVKGEDNGSIDIFECIYSSQLDIYTDLDQDGKKLYDPILAKGHTLRLDMQHRLSHYSSMGIDLSQEKLLTFYEFSDTTLLGSLYGFLKIQDDFFTYTVVPDSNEEAYFLKFFTKSSAKEFNSFLKDKMIVNELNCIENKIVITNIEKTEIGYNCNIDFSCSNW